MTDEQRQALGDVKQTFAEHRVDQLEAADGGLWVIVHEVAIGEGWNRELIDLAVKLQVTYPTTPPYPFYCEPGLVRVNGQVFSPTQTTSVEVDGVMHTQISLRIGSQENFDTENETLGSRFVAVIAWLRSPR